MKRRTFIAGLGGAAAWPVVGRAQRPASAVVGFISPGSFEGTRTRIAALHRGLAETGYIEGQNLRVEYRWAQDQNSQLSLMAQDLVARRVAVLMANSGATVRAASAATQTIPIVFTVGADPVQSGLVKSLNRPGGNITGVTVLSADLIAKRLQLLHELVPAAQVVAMLANPSNPSYFELDTKAALEAARLLGVRLLVSNATGELEIERAFAAMTEQRVGALLIGGDAVFTDHRSQIVALAARHKMPAIYHVREFTDVGGLISYGPSLPDAFYRAGLYTGRILNGERPADLPVQQSTKLELTINMTTAKVLGLTIPETLLATADAVIQ